MKLNHEEIYALLKDGREMNVNVHSLPIYTVKDLSVVLVEEKISETSYRYYCNIENTINGEKKEGIAKITFVEYPHKGVDYCIVGHFGCNQNQEVTIRKQLHEACIAIGDIHNLHAYNYHY